jgi:hypothetical protein
MMRYFLNPLSGIFIWQRRGDRAARARESVKILPGKLYPVNPVILPPLQTDNTEGNLSFDSRPEVVN